MLSAFGRRSRLLLGSLVLLGSFAAFATLGLAPVVHATDGIDEIITGSVGATDDVAAANGSAAFKKAIALVASGDAVAAYDAARSLPSDLERRVVQWAAIY
jgi:soluble lytic murein transglycosylase